MFAIWAADARALRPELLVIATGGPEDFEDEGVNTSGPVAPVTGRNHIARKVLALWDEDDPLARARLLVAFGASENLFRGAERLERFRRELARSSRELPPQERLAVRRLLEEIESRPDATEWKAAEGSVNDIIRTAFGWPRLVSTTVR